MFFQQTSCFWTRSENLSAAGRRPTLCGRFPSFTDDDDADDDDDDNQTLALTDGEATLWAFLSLLISPFITGEAAHVRGLDETDETSFNQRRTFSHKRLKLEV